MRPPRELHLTTIGSIEDTGLLVASKTKHWSKHRLRVQEMVPFEVWRFKVAVYLTSDCGRAQIVGLGAREMAYFVVQ